MKKYLALGMLLMFLAPAVCAQGPGLGIGAFAGGNIPVAQEDQATGSAFGLMARIKALNIMVLEPNIMFGKWGEPDPVDGIDLGIDGSKITSYGLDVTLGGLPGTVGFKPFGVVGAAVYSVKNDDTDYDESKLGFSFGLGVNFGLTPKFALDVRGKALIAPQEEGSKKAVLITGGLIYNFGPLR